MPAAPLIGYAYLGLFTRYVADDFCAGRNLATRGFWGSQIWTYQTHSGRFFSYFTRISAAFIGRDQETHLVPVIFLICWLLATTWAFFQLTTLLKWRLRLLPSSLFAELIVFAMLRTGPDPGQSFYWQAGSFTYTVPIILITVSLGLLPHFLIAQESGGKHVTSLILPGTLALCAAGCSETNAIFQCAGFAIAIVLCRWTSIQRARRILPVLYSGFAASLLGFLIVAAAPGNAVREAGIRAYTAPLSKTALLVKTIAASTKFIFDFLHARPLAALGVFVISLALANTQQPQADTRPGWRFALSIVAGGWVVTFLLIFSAILPGMYAFSSLPPDRALFVDHWVLLLALMLTGSVFGWLVRNWYAEADLAGWLATACAVALILPWAAKSAHENFAAIPELRRYAADWDSEDAQLRKMKSAGELEISLPWNASVASNGNIDQIGWISDDPTYFINTCTADYYGFKSLRTQHADGNHDAQQTTQRVTP
ncbi:MAG TPA: DUF6056 family protein [Candidatus Sulfotelmatobacter sp.]|nr:DUF6056 family protein [Candidatus Sulfotelmatobacter sp.]